MANSATVIGSAVSALPLALGLAGGLAGHGPAPGSRDPSELLRAINELSQQCTRETDDLHAQRNAALIALPGGKEIFDQLQKDSDAAAAAASTAIATAHTNRDRAEREAQSVRRTELDKADTDQRDADAKSRDDERTAEVKAQRTFDDDMREVNKLPLNEQMEPRANAMAKRDRAIADAKADLESASRRNRDAMQRQRQDALDKELRADEKASEDEGIALKAADADRAQAVQRAEAKMRSSFQSVAGGTGILTDFDGRFSSHEKDCHDRMEALLRRPT